MKIALAQMDVKAGDPDTNYLTIERLTKEASAQGVNIICFPEMCVGGYLVGDLWLNNDWCRWLMSFNDKIRELSKKYNIGIIYGNVYMMEDVVSYEEHVEKDWRFCNFDGRAIRFNAAYAFQNGEIIKRRCGSSKYLPDGIQPKTLLPNYRYFDDERYFMSTWDFSCTFEGGYFEMNSPFAFEIDGDIRYIGVELCEDMWCKDYNINPSFALSAMRSEIIINISASPWTIGKNKARDRRVSEVLKWEEKRYIWTWTYGGEESKNIYSEHERKQREESKDSNGVSHYREEEWEAISAHPPFAYVNCVGSQNNGKNVLVFDGASTVYGNDGKPKIFANSDYKEELLVFNTEEIPEKILERETEKVIPRKYQAIIRGIQHMSEVTGISKYVIGLSGGIDSAVVACLLVTALGKENITAINMPTQYNSKETKQAAWFTAQRLGIKYKVIPIGEAVEAKTKMVRMAADVSEVKGLTDENIQAKVRGTLLSDIGGETGAFFSCNGNKLEILLGYATLYGDWGGALAPIADLTKLEVYQMAKYINTIQGNPIPKDLVNMVIKPSAELKEDQVDPIKIGYHCAIVEQIMDYQKISAETIMQWWIDGILAEKLGISNKLLVEHEMNNGAKFVKDLEWLFSRMRASIFKRVQSVPIIVLTKTAFGYDLRESILPKFQWTAKAKKMVDKIINR